jgi:hypothetical protein
VNPWNPWRFSFLTNFIDCDAAPERVETKARSALIHSGFQPAWSYFSLQRYRNIGSNPSAL